jgi:hypothetical protein
MEVVQRAFNVLSSNNSLPRLDGSEKDIFSLLVDFLLGSLMLPYLCYLEHVKYTKPVVRSSEVLGFGDMKGDSRPVLSRRRATLLL